MFSKTEKGYLILTLGFLAAGSGIKAYRHAAVKLGPFNEAAPPLAVAASPDSLLSDFALSGPAAGPDSRSGAASQSEVLSGGDPVSESSRGDLERDTLRPPTVKAKEPHRTARSGADKSAFAGKIDLNKADASELTRVKGIGAKTAQAIVDYRRAHGPYRNFRDLLQIKGIGEKKLEKLMPNLIL